MGQSTFPPAHECSHLEKKRIMEEDLGPILLVSSAEVMIKRDSWGHSYLIEILCAKNGILTQRTPHAYMY